MERPAPRPVNRLAGRDIGIQEVQAAAKQRYARTAPDQLPNYYVGQKLNASRALLEQHSEAILTQLATDTLPGITAAKVTALGDLREAWITDNQTQGDAQSDATDERTDLTALVKTATDARITIQFAADAEYPYTTKANAAARKEFLLPANEPFTG